MYATRFDIQTLPRYKMPEEGLPAEVAHQSVKDLRAFDRNPRLNMASYVTTFMEPEAIDLIVTSLNVNLADSEIYPSSTDIQNRCLSMLADLWHAPPPTSAAPLAAGCATVGSSEACMLAALNMKKRWQDARRAEGKSTEKPNIVLGYNCQVCWEKYATHYDVEPRFCPMSEGVYVMQPDALRELVDENTVGVVAILGSTYTGHYEDVQGMSNVLDELHRDRGLDVFIHIDAASGAFVAPFLQPDLVWDFQVSRVVSISASGHKYGLVFPGVGWLVWRSHDLLHKDLDFHLAYLGSDEETITINFSRPACFVIAQYYQMLRLGRDGYRMACQNMQDMAVKLADGLADSGHFALLNDPRKCIPMVAFTLLNKHTDGDSGDGDKRPPASASGSGPSAEEGRRYSEYDIADKMKEFGWMVPAYTLAPNCKHITAMRCVIRIDMSITIIEELLKDFKTAVQWLDHHNMALYDPNIVKPTLGAKLKGHLSRRNAHAGTKHHILC